jgi:hypothetical protein
METKKMLNITKRLTKRNEDNGTYKKLAVQWLNEASYQVLWCRTV